MPALCARHQIIASLRSPPKSNGNRGTRTADDPRASRPRRWTDTASEEEHGHRRWAAAVRRYRGRTGNAQVGVYLGSSPNPYSTLCPLSPSRSKALWPGIFVPSTRQGNPHPRSRSISDGCCRRYQSRRCGRRILLHEPVTGRQPANLNMLRRVLRPSGNIVGCKPVVTLAG